MTHLHWMKTYVGDEAAATVHLSRDEFGAYELLRRYYWQHGCLPNDDDRLARIARATPDEWKNLRPVIEILFDDGWRNARLDEERANAEKYHADRVRAGRKGGKTKQSLSTARAKLKQPEPEPEPEPYSASDTEPAGWALEERGIGRGSLRRFAAPSNVVEGRNFLINHNVPSDQLDRCLRMLMEGSLTAYDIEEWSSIRGVA
ncbi:YdaU family protein [Rhizobium sp. NLR17b]|uniref:YdaU family protein n=1 Tax=Rhizobium sp. NLR17b TaxID=2731114 RepID=UPI001C82AF3C|nr:YdaU family protein [Rhizobium sp. NLR17b]